MNRMLFALFIITGFTQHAYAQMMTGVTDDPLPVAEETAPRPIHAVPPPMERPAMSSSSEPLEITADNILEWQRNDKIFIARGNALAVQGDSSVAAATLTAHYIEKDGSGMEVSRVLAEDNVVLKSRDAQAFGSKADYDLQKGYAIMTGDNLRMISPEQEVTARDKFEYWTTDGKFMAFGQAARVKRGTDTLQADTISAVMKNNEKGQRVLETLEANNNVVITTPTEKVTGNYGIYRANTNMAEIRGNVKITRGPNVLEGERAEVDMTTKTSRIFGNQAQGGRVKGVFYPNSENKPE
jgi:lipopolysaccharide export system protein LptA